LISLLFSRQANSVFLSAPPLSLSSLLVVLREGVDTDVGCLLLVVCRDGEREEGERECATNPLGKVFIV
jgi:hypothetical protein